MEAQWTKRKPLAICWMNPNWTSACSDWVTPRHVVSFHSPASQIEHTPRLIRRKSATIKEIRKRNCLEADAAFIRETSRKFEYHRASCFR